MEEFAYNLSTHSLNLDLYSFLLYRKEKKMSKDLKNRTLPKGIYQRKDGRYEARALINGVKIQLYNTDLKQLKNDFEIEKEKVKQNINIRYSNITLNEWFEEWFDNYKKPSVKETSIIPMKSKYYNTFGKCIGDMKICEIKNVDIQKVINTLQKEGRASSSMRDALGRVRQCLDSAKNNKMISDNPCFDIIVPWENTSKEKRFLSQEEQNTFLKYSNNTWYKELLYIMFFTGMRVGEIGGLKWEDIDFEKKHISIQRALSCQYSYGEKKILLTPPKTINSTRIIPFMGDVEKMLLSQKEKQENLKKQLGSKYREDERFQNLVFVTSMGSPVTRYHVEKICERIVKSINEDEAIQSVLENRIPVLFKEVYPHAIRHTFCSRCFENNMNPKIVQTIMGHQHYSTTIDIYTHVTKTDIYSEAQKMLSAVV